MGISVRSEDELIASAEAGDPYAAKIALSQQSIARSLEDSGTARIAMIEEMTQRANALRAQDRERMRPTMEDLDMAVSVLRQRTDDARRGGYELIRAEDTFNTLSRSDAQHKQDAAALAAEVKRQEARDKAVYDARDDVKNYEYAIRRDAEATGTDVNRLFADATMAANVSAAGFLDSFELGKTVAQTASTVGRRPESVPRQVPGESVGERARDFVLDVISYFKPSAPD
jgi:hypothetical protein